MMGFMKYLSTALTFSQQPSTAPASVKNHFHLEVWLENSPLNHQTISWIEAGGGLAEGFFGINIVPPGMPPPEGNLATFVRDTAYPESLFMASPNKSTVVVEEEEEKITNVVVDETGEFLYGVKTPTEDDFPVYTGNFSIDYFTNWPDKKSYDFLQFQPPGFVFGTFLACPKDFGNRRIYQLHAITPAFHHGGCITLDWLVTKEVESKAPEIEVLEEFIGHELL